MKSVKFNVEYRSLDWDRTPIRVVARIFSSSPWEGISEGDARKQALEYAAAIRAYHLHVSVIRIGPRGGRYPES